MQNNEKDFHKKLLGKLGEKKATEFLKGKGYKILETNYKTRVGEIDVIAKDGEYVVFIEVKTRTGTKFGMPSEAVNRQKQTKYFSIASEYLIKNRLEEAKCRFDVIEVLNNEIIKTHP